MSQTNIILYFPDPVRVVNLFPDVWDHNLTWTFFFLGILIEISPPRLRCSDDLNIEYGTGWCQSCKHFKWSSKHLSFCQVNLSLFILWFLSEAEIYFFWFPFPFIHTGNLVPLIYRSSEVDEEELKVSHQLKSSSLRLVQEALKLSFFCYSFRHGSNKMKYGSSSVNTN